MFQQERTASITTIKYSKHTQSETYLCLEEDEARRLRREPGDRELRELEYEELRGQRDAGKGTHADKHAHAVNMTRT